MSSFQQSARPSYNVSGLVPALPCPSTVEYHKVVLECQTHRGVRHPLGQAVAGETEGLVLKHGVALGLAQVGEVTPGLVEISPEIFGLYRNLGIVKVKAVVVIGLESLQVVLKLGFVASSRQIKVSSGLVNFPLFPERVPRVAPPLTDLTAPQCSLPTTDLAVLAQ